MVLMFYTAFIRKQDLKRSTQFNKLQKKNLKTIQVATQASSFIQLYEVAVKDLVSQSCRTIMVFERSLKL